MNKDGLARLTNQLTGLGNESYDTHSAIALAPFNPIRQEFFDRCYQTLWPCRKVIDYQPDMMAREWGHLTLGSNKWQGEDLVSAVNKKFTKLRSLYRLAQKMANKDGGAIIVRYIDDGLPADQPVNRRAIKTIDYSRVLTRWEVNPNLLKEQDYLNPTYYDIYTKEGKKFTVHRDRVIRFRGNFVSYDYLQYNCGWEDSVLIPFLEPCLRYTECYGYIAGSVKTFEVVVHMIEDLFGRTETQEGEEKLLKRFQLNQQQMSVFRGLIADKDQEDIKIVARNYGGIADILDKLKAEMVAASGLTKPQLLSEHPTGLSATGESERLAEADIIRSLQLELWHENILKDCEYYLLARECPTRGKLPRVWDWEWRSLFQLYPSEKAQLQKHYAELDKLNIESNIYTSDEARYSRYAGSEFGENIILQNLPSLNTQSSLIE